MEYLRMSVFPVQLQENTVDVQVYYSWIMCKVTELPVRI